jgi:hypothetical protein
MGTVSCTSNPAGELHSENIWTKPSVCTQLQSEVLGSLRRGKLQVQPLRGEAGKLMVKIPEILLRSPLQRQVSN